VSDYHVLLLRLGGALQAWGIESRFSVRDTGREPSKSGVIGLLMASKGCPRDHPIEELAVLRMGVRSDIEGSVLRDYHTAGKEGYLTSRGVIERVNVIPGNRYYLMDARFLVALEGDDLAFLRSLHEALRDPVWPLYLGRKSCVPGEPVWLCDGLREREPLEQALGEYPWLGPAWREPPERVRVVLEDPDGPQVRPDRPLSFAERRFAPRRVRTEFWPVPPVKEPNPCTSPS
jgi:CRISPR system Cascade subunit CasD